MYATGRFASGRSVRCACGSRVGRIRATGVPEAGGEPRFFADVMLSGLARWLRVLGYDVAWEPGIADEELVRRGAAEGRFVLTCDRRLAEEWWVDNLLVLHSQRPLEQLREVAQALHLRAEPAFSRCTRCNEPLRAAQQPDGRVPPDVSHRRGGVQECPACDRLYWEGSHTERMRRTLEEVLGG